MEKPVLILTNNDGIKVESDLFPIEKTQIKIGRGSNVDLCIPSQFISRLQAKIYAKGNRWFIIDEKSKNGTFVNGSKIGVESVELKHSDIISFSNKIDYFFQTEDMDSSETQTVVSSSSKYGVLMIEESEEVIVDDIMLNPRLSDLEWKFLSILMEEPGRIFDYKYIYKKLWNIEEDVFAFTNLEKKWLQGVKNDISKKLVKQGITRDVIKSRNNKGYQLVEKESEK